MKKNTILIAICLFISSCGLTGNKSDKFIGFWQGNVDFSPYGSHTITYEIAKNADNNLSVHIYLDNQEPISDIYTFNNDCLTKNNESICYDEKNKTLLLLTERIDNFSNLAYIQNGRPIVLKKLDKKPSSSLTNDNAVNSNQKIDDSLNFEKYQNNPELLEKMMTPGDTVTK
jgi:hypothetical protein